eukprot:scaffold320841_cov27-Tisochrysis_lutea.AAC.1
MTTRMAEGRCVRTPFCKWRQTMNDGSESSTVGWPRPRKWPRQQRIPPDASAWTQHCEPKRL